MKLGALVAVEWVDAMVIFDLKSMVIPDAPTVSTVGWLVRDDDNCVAVASERFDEHDELPIPWRGVTVIPRGMVLKLRTLRGEKT